MLANDGARPTTDLMEEVLRVTPGWTPLDQLCALFNLTVASAAVPGDIIEIGSWCGRSTVALGMAARLSEGGRIHCIDVFPKKHDWYVNTDGSFSFKVDIGGETISAYTTQTVWREPFERDIAPLYDREDGVFERFLETLRRFDLEANTSVTRGTIEHFAETAPAGLMCRLAFIDGDHGYHAVVRDIEYVERWLSPGGWICFDDAFTGYDGVDRAVQERIIASGRYDLTYRVTRKCFIARRKPLSA